MKKLDNKSHWKNLPLLLLFVLILLIPLFFISAKESLIVAVAVSILLLLAIVTSPILSERKLEIWCRNNNFELLKWKGLPLWERPQEWQLLGGGRFEWFECYEICVRDSGGREQNCLIAWHSTFAPNPQVVWSDIESNKRFCR